MTAILPIHVRHALSEFDRMDFAQRALLGEEIFACQPNLLAFAIGHLKEAGLLGIRNVRPGDATARQVAAPGDHPLPATRSGSARRPRAVLNFRPLRPITEP